MLRMESPARLVLPRPISWQHTEHRCCWKRDTGHTWILGSPATPRKLLDTMFRAFFPFTVMNTPGALHHQSQRLLTATDSAIEIDRQQTRRQKGSGNPMTTKQHKIACASRERVSAHYLDTTGGSYAF